MKEAKIKNIYTYKYMLPARQFIHDNILPGLLKSDDVHLSQWGNHVFMRDLVLPKSTRSRNQMQLQELQVEGQAMVTISSDPTAMTNHCRD